MSTYKRRKKSQSGTRPSTLYLESLPFSTLEPVPFSNISQWTVDPSHQSPVISHQSTIPSSCSRRLRILLSAPVGQVKSATSLLDGSLLHLKHQTNGLPVLLLTKLFEPVPVSGGLQWASNILKKQTQFQSSNQRHHLSAIS